MGAGGVTGGRGDQTDATWVEKTPVEVQLRMDLKNKQVTTRKRGRIVTMLSQTCPVFISLK